MRLAAPIMIMASMLLLGCASIPQESVQLSVTLGRDLHEVQKAHRALVIKYFGRMKGDINQFVDNAYRPYMIKTSMKDFQLLDRLGKIGASNESPDSLEIMEIYVSMLTEQIENYRRELLQRIEHQETEVLMALDDAYQKLQNANAIVTGHLASIKKVEDAQAELLARVGLENYHKEFVDKTVLVSDTVAKLSAEAQKTDKKMDVEKLSKEIKTVVDKFK